MVCAGLRGELFVRIDGASEREVIADLENAVEHLRPQLDEEFNNLGYELWLWLGLKRDGDPPTMADDYRKMLLRDWPWLEVTKDR